MIYEKSLIDNRLLVTNIPLQSLISDNRKFNKTFNLQEPSLQSALGLKWNVELNTLQITKDEKFRQELDNWHPFRSFFFFFFF